MAYTRNPTWQDGEGLTLIRAVHLNTIEDGLVAAAATADSALALANTKADATRQIIAGTGLSGGGSLTVDRTLAVVYGTAAGTAAQGNDSRLSDARTPLAHTQAASTISDSTAVGRSVLTAADAAAARTAIGAGTSSLALGTTGTTAAAGNDARFGSPAGWVNATTIADGTDLDTLTNAGIYWMPSTAAAGASSHAPSTTGGWVEVIYQPSFGVMQRYAVASSTTPAYWVRQRFGPTWGAWRQDVVSGIIGGGDATGTGSPEGVLSAPVGTYYTDTAGTNGQWRWLKKTGSGNTGWVEFGDNWRISPALVGGSDLNLAINPGLYVYPGPAAPVNGPVAAGLADADGHLWVARYSTTHVMQMFTSFTNALVFTRNSKNGGTTWSPWTAGSEASGVGSPEGVVVGNVGMYYNDRAGTNGAWRWQKRSGSGSGSNTGWKPVSGDTGWRNIASLLLPTEWTASSKFLIRRTDNMVFCASNNSGGSLQSVAGAADPRHVVDVPAGFRPYAFAMPKGMARNMTDGTYMGVNVTDYSPWSIRMENTFAGTPAFSWSLTWMTDDPWPTSLPGIAG